MTKRNLFVAAALALLVGAPGLAKDLATPKERMEAIAPLLQARIEGRDLRRVLTKRSAQSGVSEARLMLWMDLFLSHGHTGLVTISQASAAEMARREAGTWKMTSRVMDGQTSAQNAYQFNEILEIGRDYSRVRNLSLEAGTLEPALRQGLPGDGSFRLGAFGEILHREVMGEEYGLAPGEVGVLQVFQGELYGVGYPGIDNNIVLSRVEALWVKQGDVYRTAYLTHEFQNLAPNSQFQGLSVPPGPERDKPGEPQKAASHGIIHDIIGAIASGFTAFSLTYSNFDSTENYTQTSTTSQISDLASFWQRAKQDSRLLDPMVALAPKPTPSEDPVPVQTGTATQKQ